MNPYWGVHFFHFFALFFSRLFSGALFTGPLADDEVQLLVIAGVAIATSLIGVLLVLRKMTMLANSLSHTTLLGLALTFILFGGGLALTHPLLLMVAAFLSALLTAFATEFLHKVVRLQEDASINLVFSSLFALSIILVTLYARSTHLEIDAIMGNVDALHPSDLKGVLGTLLLNAALVMLFIKQWRITSFDPHLAKTLGISPRLFNTLLLLLTSITLMAAFRAVGVFLVLAFIALPPLIARRFTHRLATLLWLAPAIAALTAWLAVALSRHLLSAHHMPLSTAGIATTLLGALFTLTTFLPATARPRARN